MMSVHEISCRAYGALLALYPKEFRERFGSEMRLVFADQLRGELRVHGFRGVLRVWRTAFAEILTAAAPLQLRSSAVIAAALSILISSFICLEFFKAVSR
jgi:hypothetical protein